MDPELELCDTGLSTIPEPVARALATAAAEANRLLPLESGETALFFHLVSVVNEHAHARVDPAGEAVVNEHARVDPAGEADYSAWIREQGERVMIDQVDAADEMGR